MKSAVLFAGLAVLAAAMPVSAQEYGVNRRVFTFLDNEVTIEVAAETGGTLHVVRGEPGRLDVSGRVEGGFSSFALGGRGNRLRLTAVGGESASFIVVVPEEAYLRVQLPNRRNPVGNTRPGGTFHWDAPGSLAAHTAPRAAPAPDGFATGHIAAEAPRVVNVPNLNSARTITVRVQSGPFEVGGTQWMSVQHGSTTSLEIRTGSDAQDLDIVVPVGTRDFTLRLGGRTALVVRAPEITAYCEPMIEQVLAGGAVRRYTFTPEMGRLRCR